MNSGVGGRGHADVAGGPDVVESFVLCFVSCRSASLLLCSFLNRHMHIFFLLRGKEGILFVFNYYVKFIFFI